MNIAADIDEKERLRLALQATLDSNKSQRERNRLGQFATPASLAGDILHYAALTMPPTASVHFLDPAIGTGSFFSALLKTMPEATIAEALGFEIDPAYGEPAAQLWREHRLTLRLTDFTRAAPSPRFNLIICNPPYVRHHHLSNDDKRRLQQATWQASGMRLSGLAGLYCHFLGLTHAWMCADAIAGWLIPSEFMDVNYGRAVKHYLLERVTLLHIHRFDPGDIQFADALVSSAIVWLRNTTPPPDHEVKFTFGGTLLEPKVSAKVNASVLADEPKWTRFPVSNVRYRSGEPTLGDYFHVKRGIATGDNKFFILAEDEIRARRLPLELFTPILPSPRYVPDDEVKGYSDGSPALARRLFLLNTRLSEREIEECFPGLAAYLREGRARGVHERYLCRHRSPWYSQEYRLAAPLVCTYIGRGDAKSGRPFRFILNESRATVANVYLAMYPTVRLADAIERDGSLIRRIWERLKGISVSELLGEGRVYGGGLYKLEPRELSRVNAGFLLDLMPYGSLLGQGVQLRLLDQDDERPAKYIV